jgi:hypothetical protein
MAKELKPEPDPASDQDAPEVLGPPKSYRMHIALGFTVIILFQVTLLWVLLPAGQSPPLIEGLDPRNGAGGFEDTDPIGTVLIKPGEVTERAINEAKPFTGKKMNGDVTESYSLIMYVTVRSKEVKKFEKRYKDCERAIIGSVSEMLDANVAEHHKELGYTTLKEKAKKEINRVLGTPWVQSVIILNFSFTEQQ